MKRLKRQNLRKLGYWKVVKSTLLKNSNRRELKCQSQNVEETKKDKE